MSDKPQQTQIDGDDVENISPNKKQPSDIFEEVAQREAELMVDDDEAEYESLSGKPLAQLYKEVNEREAKMTDAERIKQLREGVNLFNEMFPDFYEEDDAGNDADE